MPLVKTLIKINGLYYAGESSETYNSSFNGTGWVDYKTNELNRLAFTGDKEKAYVTEGNRNLKSVIDKIFQRVNDQEIDFEKIEIIKL